MQPLLLLQLKKMKLSIDWSRLAPDPNDTTLHSDTVQFYSLMLQQNGIDVHIALFDDEIPAKLQVKFVRVFF